MDAPQPTEILALLTRIDAKLGDGTTQFQLDVAARFDEMTRRFGAMDNRFGAIETRLDAIDIRFGAVEKRLDAIDIRFGAVEKRLDAIDIRFGAIEKRLDAMDGRIDHLERRFDTFEHRFSRKLDRLRSDLVDHMERLHVELALRVQDLEGRPPHGTGGGQALAG